MEQTWYLKYRPQTFDELDVASVRETLKKVVASGKWPHAFLFSGPRGTGKTSAARILAKAVNCTGQDKPCNNCTNCKAIAEGVNFDVVEMDAASNRGIDEARALRENIKLRPMSGKFKVYIIDEAHMLTTEAANALLKTLEEPPAHVIFVLCTTEPDKLPETVVSRCMQVKFRQPTLDEAVASLAIVVKAEGLESEESALRLVVGEARGGLRDGKKLLEQVFLTHGKLDERSVRQTLGMLESVDPGEFGEILRQGRVQEGLEMISKLVETGIGSRVFVERVIERLRQVLLADVGLAGELVPIIERLQWAYTQMKEAAVEQLPLEIVVIEMGKGEIKPPEKKEAKQVVEPLPVVVETPVLSGLGIGDLQNKWDAILKEIKPLNHSVEGLLKSTKPMEFDGRVVKLEVFYKFHKDKLETEKCRQVVEGTVAKVLGVKNVKLDLVLGKKEKSELAGKVEEDIVAAAESIFKVQAV